MKDAIKALLATAGAAATAVALSAYKHWGPRTSTETPHSQPDPPLPQPEPSAERASLKPKKQRREPEGLTAKKLLDVLTLTRPVMQRNPTLPILECVRLEPGKVTVTDIETRLTIEMPELRVPPVCVNAARLREAVRRVTGAITVDLDDAMLVINGSLRLATLPAGEYPASTPPATSWESGAPFVVPLRLSDVLPAMSREGSRPQLNGVCFDFANGAVVASDGHRLHRVTGDRLAGGGTYTISAIAARTLAQFAVQGVHGQVFTRNEQRGGTIAPLVELVFLVPGVTLRTRAVDVEFPDYLQVVPSPQDRYAVTCETTPLVEALRQAIAVGPKNVRCTVSLTSVEGGLRVQLESQAEGSCSVLVPGSGWQLKRYVGVQAPYLLDLIQCAGGKVVTLSIDDATKPLLLRADAFTGVVMPVRIDPTNRSDMEDKPATVPVNGSHTDGEQQSA